MAKAFLLAFLLSCAESTLLAQTPEDSVKATVNKLFTAMKNGDGATTLLCFTDSAVLQTIARNKEGETIVKNEKVADFATLVGTMPKNLADERIQFEVIKVDGPLAVVWTPYSFYLDGLFSHCGVNSFQLIRQNGQWKIHYLIDTRRKQGCSSQLP
ncbi:MAG: nuclear transport factor 2 family protein [Chitinophagaceae bacterium]|nr:nuclear transport factor 2 family protein [Chitinophagaceae bacterium]MDP1765251.1 nuclear transport factor 2 family protein [Sediminibacterium sp.]MDP1812448.1 nuclear transport factor 2 family protein [Sediminibacterium sp.]MDP3129240.1 nuclear transport factor 2 family protein [Sediminibacterium sp.]MDP3666639.1 nuclear transport factor 2 family protein [Sediminibacterium sp.]